ncbi:lipopolysaccharide assembly LapA domain-containing protein [Oceanobacillus sp. Castelsardo]|uniref:LapA family protein n=1 Tax=Oceanobacillus sp. Castelsardo TaxID=1851204 RepID=UPI000837C599|nr:lipopolysaccharide assembly protein LapA domain-containing protein [Oceanobacillus sp. Castelsardo]
MKGQSYVLLAIIFIIIVAVFAIMNVEPVEVNYLFWSGSSPLILVILFSVLMGGLITAAVGALKMFKLQKQMKQLKKEKIRMETILNENELLDKDSGLEETEIGHS